MGNDYTRGAFVGLLRSPFRHFLWEVCYATQIVGPHGLDFVPTVLVLCSLCYCGNQNDDMSRS
jgi:hypothetical protein